MKKYLPHDTTVGLWRVLIETGEASPKLRETLMASIAPAFVASLPILDDPASQIFSDLTRMNGVPYLTSKELPLHIWLSNSVHWLQITKRPEQTRFQEALNDVTAESSRRLKAFTQAEAIEPTALPHSIPSADTTHEENRKRLEEFLIPFQGVLRFTRELFDMLRDEQELASLEYRPETLRQYFGTLPDQDPRKTLWMMYIDLLQKENRRGIELVKKQYGKIVLPEFRSACDEYLKHAELWEVVWKGFKNQIPLPEGISETHQLQAPRFPEGLDDALSQEIAEVRRQADLQGLAPMHVFTTMPVLGSRNFPK